MWSAAKIAALIVTIFLVFLPRSGAAQAKIEESARMLFDSANGERSSRGIPALKWDASLAEAARGHALRMAQQNTLSHQFPGEPDVPTREKQAGARMSAAAENVAVGPSVVSIHTGWMNSPPHRHNLLDPRLNSIGIAVVQQGENFFAVEDFSRALAALSLAEQEKEVEAPIRAAGLKIRFDNGDARRVCEDGTTSSLQPRFLARFSTTDLRALPASLERAIQSSQYVAAEVGACAKPSEDGLSQYHIAVLLY
ncbi:MAG: CAP domain-containing protein [Candidatus Acidiferrales bacterium]